MASGWTSLWVNSSFLWLSSWPLVDFDPKSFRPSLLLLQCWKLGCCCEVLTTLYPQPHHPTTLPVAGSLGKDPSPSPAASQPHCRKVLSLGNTPKRCSSLFVTNPLGTCPIEPPWPEVLQSAFPASQVFPPQSFSCWQRALTSLISYFLRKTYKPRLNCKGAHLLHCFT